MAALGDVPEPPGEVPPVAPLPGRWQIATVTAIVQETPTVRSFRFALPDWRAHLPGQHYDLRLTAPDGYQAQRSYSVASSPLDAGSVELTVDRLEDGEVSTYLHDQVVVGDRIELRGPFASYFVWRGESPILLVGGGSGVVPLMAMLRHRRDSGSDARAKLVYSVRDADEVIYARELAAADLRDDVHLTFSRRPPEGWTGHVGRITPALVAATGLRSGTAYLCGSNAFVESASRLVLHAGFRPEDVRTERFGPTR